MPTRKTRPVAKPEAEASAPDRAALAAALGLAVSETERALGYGEPADKIFAVADRGDYWGVVTVDGAKHRVPKAA